VTDNEQAVELSRSAFNKRLVKKVMERAFIKEEPLNRISVDVDREIEFEKNVLAMLL